MRLLFVADGRSPIALNWIAYFVDQGHEVHLASTYPCMPLLELASLHLAPVALSEAVGPGGQGGGAGGRGRLRRLIPVGARTAVRQWVGPLTLPRAAQRLKQIIRQVRPDLVHAMRIPYEGMLAALAEPPVPLLVSVWGNDFTLHAPANPFLGRATRRTLQSAAALHADCHRDVRLARAWGFAAEKPAVVLPGNGGIQLDLFAPLPPDVARTEPPIVVNPRGFRAYVRNDTFFQAIPLVLKVNPHVRFVCPAMAGEAQAQRWCAELGIGDNVELLPWMPRLEVANLFRRARVVVSPSTHDGTPNTVLEAMACGCLPVAGDIESLREWITPGWNGLLVDPADPQALADAILLALEAPGLCVRAAAHNRRLIAERAAYGRVMEAAERFYREIV